MKNIALIAVLLCCCGYKPYSEGVMYRNDPEHLEILSRVSPNVKFTHDRILKFLEKYNLIQGDILDIGVRSPLTLKIENRFNIALDNTGLNDDFNFNMTSRLKKYDLIICSHVVEHVPNIMTLIHSMKKRMKKNSILVIAWPVRSPPNENHYYEIPLRHLGIILNDAGLYFDIIEKIKVENGFDYIVTVKKLKGL